MQSTPSPVNLNDPLLVTDGFALWHEARAKDDAWNDQDLHVSDLHKCAREVWARRNGLDAVVNTDDTERKFEMGRAFEDQVRSALSERFVDTHFTYMAQADIDQLADGMPLSGHIDFVIINEKTGERQPVEVKTTTFYPTTKNGKRVRIAPTEAQLGYRVQCASYAIALKAQTFRIIIACRESGMMAEFVYKTENYHDMVREKYALMTAKTGVGLPEPTAELPPRDTFNVKTGASWMCSYCSHLGCERNTNPAALEVPA